MAINKLGNAAWKHLKEGTHDDGGGLKLVVRPPRQDQPAAKVTKAWVFKFTFLGKAGSCNIGSAAKVSIAAARAHRDTLNDALAMNEDPKTAWRRIKRPHLNGPDCRFKAVAEDCWKSKYSDLKHKNAKAWISAVRKVVYPRLGETLIYDITTADIMDVFADYVEKSPIMALKVMERVMQIFDRADPPEGKDVNRQTVSKAVRKFGLRSRKNDEMPTDLEDDGFGSVPFEQVPNAVRLSCGDDLVGEALYLTILTACRIGSVVKARWKDVDLDAAEWTIPPEHLKLKDRGEHVVPLSPDAVKCLRRVKKVTGGTPLVFYSARAGVTGHISREGIQKRLAVAGILDANFKQAHVHGFRASFKSWATEARLGTHEEREWCLHHKFWGSAVEKAYLKNSTLPRAMMPARRALLNYWSDYIAERITLAELRGDEAENSNVISLEALRRAA